MRTKSGLIFLLITSCLLVVLPAHASYLSLATSVRAKTEGNNLNVLISVINKGDESAYNVQAEVLAGGQKLLAEKQAELGINSTYKAALTARLNYITPGLYPLVVFIHYTDANQYPFTALNGQIFAYKSGSLPVEVFGRIKPAAFWKSGELKLNLKNIGGNNILAQTRLVVPVELTAGQAAVEAALQPRSEVQLSFPVKNFSALSGSNYQVFAVTEYEKDGRHFSALSPGTVRIAEERKLFGLGYPLVIGLLALLLVIFIGAQFIKR